MISQRIKEVESCNGSNMKSVKFNFSAFNIAGADKFLKSCQFYLDSKIEYDITRGIFMSDYYIKISGNTCKRDTLVILNTLKEYEKS